MWCEDDTSASALSAFGLSPPHSASKLIVRPATRAPRVSFFWVETTLITYFLALPNAGSQRPPELGARPESAGSGGGGTVAMVQ